MKRIVFVILLCLLTGCKESPESDIVINKNENKLEQQITEKAEKNKKDISVKKKTDDFTVVTGDVKVEVDANVVSIDGNLPVVKVAPHEITSADLQLWGTVLFAKEEAYDPGVPKSKKELEEEILQWKKWLVDKEKEGDEEVIDHYKETIANLENAYENAPDNTEKQKTDYEFHPAEYYLDEGTALSQDDPYGKNMQFRAVTDYDDGIRKLILSTNRNEKDYSMHSLGFCLDLLDEDVSRTLKECTKEEALALAEQIKKALGLEDWIMTASSQEKSDSVCTHLFTYTRYYEGIPTLDGYEIDLHSDDLYAANLYYEELSMRVENGEIADISWYSPMDIIEVENDNVQTLSFEQVYEAFKGQMQSQYSKNTYLERGWFDENDPEVKNMELTLQIKSIEEGMFRIKVKDSSDEYRMVPAWIFKGSTNVNGEPLAGEAYIVINAIDGSVINPTLGY